LTLLALRSRPDFEEKIYLLLVGGLEGEERGVGDGCTGLSDDRLRVGESGAEEEGC
jgi:hypothetical protein